MLVIFLITVLVSIVFERQERRHLFMESLEFQRMRKEMPKPAPKQPKLESWMGVVVGCYVFILGIVMVGTELLVLHYTPEMVGNIGNITTEGGATMAAGIAIMIISFRLIRQHRRINKLP